ncbi:MAG: enoyl-CoA hydratase-related protein [Anaerolineales bacterium]|nr:enoyl-CoA hydratase-related protein [Anaerolineales bacterium]MDW8276759.1 enoyl-CoA hydratase-related protein [Anaerolineales bacterium]
MPFLNTDLREGILTLTIERPPANAFNLSLIEELLSAFRQAGRDSQTRVVVLTGAGKVFSAGQDITEMKASGETISYRRHLLETYNPLILQIRNLPRPVIAAINGTCAGASLGIALACDLRFAADSARFVVGFNGIGLAPDSGVSLLLPALVGLGRATELTFGNQPLSAEKALEWGLVNRIVPFDNLMAETRQTAVHLAAGAVGVFGLSKRLFNHAVLPNLEEMLDYEAHIQEIASKSPEHREGIAAFLEKRSPKF